MRFCIKCGEEIKKPGIYCGKCGKILEEMPNDYIIDEVKVQFCPKCGSRVEKNYCPQCGTYATNLTVREGLQVNKIISSLGQQTQKQMSQLKEKINVEGVADLSKSGKKVLGAINQTQILKDALIFSGVLAVLFLTVVLGISLFIRNFIIDSISAGGLNAANYDLMKKFVDLKPIVGSMLYGVGSKLQISINDGQFKLGELFFKMPFILMPISILITFVADRIRESITKNKKTLVSILAMSACSAIIITIIIGICNNKVEINPSVFGRNSFYGYVSNQKAWSVVVKLGINMGTAFLAVFLVTAIMLFFLPGSSEKEEGMLHIRQVSGNMILMGLACMLIPAFTSAIGIHRILKLGMGIGSILYLTIFNMGSIFSIPVTGNGNIFNYDMIAKGNFKIISNIFTTKYKGYIDQKVNAKVGNPYMILCLIAFLVFFIGILYVAVRLLMRSEDLKLSAGLMISSSILASTVLAFWIKGCSIGMKGKMFSGNQMYLKDLTESNSIVFNSGSLGFWANFIKILFLFAIAFVLAFIIKTYVSHFYYAILSIKKGILTGGMIAILLVSSISSIFLVGTKTWTKFVNGTLQAFGSDEVITEYDLKIALDDLENGRMNVISGGNFVMMLEEVLEQFGASLGDSMDHY